MIRESIRGIFHDDKYFANRISELNGNGELEDLYKELQIDILDIVCDETEGEATKSDIWEVVIREGLYQSLAENPSVALEFLLTTTYGPTVEYKDRLNLANDHSELIVLIGLSALVNDTVHQKNNRSNNIDQSDPRAEVDSFNTTINNDSDDTGLDDNQDDSENTVLRGLAEFAVIILLFSSIHSLITLSIHSYQLWLSLSFVILIFIDEIVIN